MKFSGTTAGSAMIIALLASCSSPELPAVPVTTHVIRVIAGGELTDTVQADVPQALVVQLPVAQAGVTVGFWPKQVGPRSTERGMWVCPLQLGNCQLAPLYAVTDSLGRASVRIKFGTIAGSTSIYLVADALGLADSVHYTVLPVAPAGFGFGVRDSSAYVGNSYSTQAHLVDRFGNTVSGTFTATSTGSAATITANGVFTARQVGRASALFMSGAFTDTAWITVPPHGTIAAFNAGINGPESIATFELDGSALQTRIVAGEPDYGQLVDWLPNGDVVYSGPNERLFAVDPSGTTQRVSDPASTANYEAMASTAKDGSVVYSAWSPGDDHASVWRVTSVGATPAKVPLPASSVNTWMAAPSPDGRQIAYVSDAIHIADIVSGALNNTLPGSGSMPRWSPTGDRILFNDDTTLYVTTISQSARQQLGPRHYYYPRADWSADGNWVIARTRNRLELINTVTNDAVPMPPWTLPYIHPAWRR